MLAQQVADSQMCSVCRCGAADRGRATEMGGQRLARLRERGVAGGREKATITRASSSMGGRRARHRSGTGTGSERGHGIVRAEV